MLYHIHVYSVNGMIEIDTEAENETEAKKFGLTQLNSGMKLQDADCSKIALAFSEKVSDRQYRTKSYYACQCYSEVINIERSIDILSYKDKAWDASVNFAIYHCGTQNHRPTLREKLRHCWKILKTGKNYADEIILSIDDAKEMGKDLLRMCDEVEIKEEAEKMLSLRKE